MEGKINSYKDLIVWQKSMDLVVAVYELAEKLPNYELYGLSSQLRRCSVSIPSNIAEGRRRSTAKDFRHFLIMAYASGAELETQIDIVKRLYLGVKHDLDRIESLLNEVMRMLNKMTNNCSS